MGGDLNTKKSWHPNTIKNQERVWKAEQAAAEEQKRIQELKRERCEERDREKLNELVRDNFGSSASGGTGGDNRLHWMYDKPDAKIQQEDYLLGKAIDSNYEQTNKLEQDIIPAVARRVVGSSMLTTANDSQVDLARKVREDPLLLVKERERAARAALLNNPLQRRRLTELLRQEQVKRKEGKVKKKSKNNDNDLDNALAAKLNALGDKKGIDLATLLNSESSSSESSSDEDTKHKKKKTKHDKHKKKAKKAKSKKKKKHSSKSKSDDEDDDEKEKRYRSKEDSSKTSKFKSRKRRSSGSIDDETDNKRSKRVIEDNEVRHQGSPEDRRYYAERRPSPPRINKRDRDDTYRDKRKMDDHNRGMRKMDENNKGSRRTGMSEEERAAKLAAMASAGAERELDRGRRVAQQRAADDRDAQRRSTHLVRNEARALPESLESRIHSNRHYIQRDKRHMNENFARR